MLLLKRSSISSLKCEFIKVIFKSKTNLIHCKACMLSNDLKTMADSPVQGERFQLAHNYLKN